MKTVLYVYVWGPPLSETGQAPPGTGRLTGYKFRTQTFCANDFPAFGWKYYFRDIPVWPRNLQTMRKGQAASLLSAGRRLFDLAKLSSPSKWVIKHFYSNSYDIWYSSGQWLQGPGINSSVSSRWEKWRHDVLIIPEKCWILPEHRHTVDDTFWQSIK